MKAKTNTIVVLILLAYSLGLNNASAFYDPGAQRWPNRDPIQEQGGINLYGLCSNDGVDAIDSYGLDTSGNQLWISLALTYLSLNNTTALNNSQINDGINDPKVQSFGQELLGKARSKWACGKSGSFSAAPSEGAINNISLWAGTGTWQLFMSRTPKRTPKSLKKIQSD